MQYLRHERLIKMNSMHEVEAKYYIGNDVRALSDQIARLGWIEDKRSSQDDIYYTSRHKDLIASEECLRIRSTGSYDELTWKPPTTGAMKEEGQYWKEELNIDISDKVSAFRDLLKRLDFVEIVTVHKSRTEYRVDDTTSVALDYIDRLGWFVEIETFSDPELAATALQKNDSIAAALGLATHNKVTIPYRDLVLQGHV